MIALRSLCLRGKPLQPESSRSLLQWLFLTLHCIYLVYVILNCLYACIDYSTLVISFDIRRWNSFSFIIFQDYVDYLAL